MARSNLTGLTSRRPFTILGIVLALLVIAAFVLVAINASAGQGVAQENVVVATRNLSPRIPIEEGSLQLKSIPVGGFPADILFHKLSDVKGMIPVVTILQDQPITINMIAKPGAALGSQSQVLPIPAGFVAVALPTSEQQGVAGYIEPGDYINIIATVDVGGRIATDTVFTNMHVIRVGTQTSDAAAQSGGAIASSLTVVVTQCQAEYLTWFLAYAALKYTLVSYLDPTPTGTDTRDPKCIGAGPAGVSLKQVQAAYPQLF